MSDKIFILESFLIFKQIYYSLDAGALPWVVKRLLSKLFF